MKRFHGSGAGRPDAGAGAGREQGLTITAGCQLVPWQFDANKPMNFKRTFRRASYLVTRLVANMGAAGTTPLLTRFSRAVLASKPQRRWLEGFYLDVPEEWDDPYRFFRW